MTILIDNGHGIETPGKRSPDGLFREYSYTREIARRVVSELSDCGYDARLLVPEIEDIPDQTKKWVERERLCVDFLKPEEEVFYI